MTEPHELIAIDVLQLDQAATIDADDPPVDADVLLHHESLVIIVVFGDEEHVAIQRIWVDFNEFQPQIGDGVFESAFFWLPGLLPVVGRPQRALVELFAKRLINQS